MNPAALKTSDESTGRLLRLLDEERRRLARDLHDTTAQDLTAIGLGLTRVLQLLPGAGAEQARALVKDCLSLVESSGREVRTLSYLLHPPLLDELGLAAALPEFIEGLVSRSGMAVEFECAAGYGRLPRDLETSLFRVAQEGLAQARQRAGVGLVRVRLWRESDQVLLELRESGGADGIRRREDLPGERGVLGAGVESMRERVGQFGGELEVESTVDGRCVRARVPIFGVGARNRGEAL